MLLKFKNAFKMEEESKKIRFPYAVIGLKILVQISQGKSNIVVKTAFKSTGSASRQSLPGCEQTEYSCYLKLCHLCNKKLSLDKEVYMYRGNQGFCSVECRDRQIVLDEMKELENSTKKMTASYRHCYNGGDRRETQILIEDLRRRRRHYNKPQSSKKIQWAIIA